MWFSVVLKCAVDTLFPLILCVYAFVACVVLNRVAQSQRLSALAGQALGLLICQEHSSVVGPLLTPAAPPVYKYISRVALLLCAITCRPCVH